MLYFKKVVLLCLFVIFDQALSWGQDPHFMNWRYHILNANPAFTGQISEKRTHRFSGGYHNQWQTSLAEDNYDSYGFSYDHKLVLEDSNCKIAFGIGGHLNVDHLGSYLANNTLLYDEFNGNLLGGLQFTANDERGKLLVFSIGVGFGLRQYRFDTKHLSFDTQFVAGEGFNEGNDNGEGLPLEGFVNRILPNLNAGLGVSFKNKRTHGRFGVGMFHLIPDKFSLVAPPITGREPMQMMLNLHADVTFIEVFQVDAIYMRHGLPGSYESNGQGRQWQSVFNAYFRPFRDIGQLNIGVGARLGGSQRSNMHIDELLPGLRIDVGGFSGGVSLGLNMSKWRQASRGIGSFELVCSYSFGKSKARCCPSF